MDNLWLMVNTNIDEPLSFIGETIRVLTPPWIIMIPSPSKSWGTFFTTVRDQKKTGKRLGGETYACLEFITSSHHLFHMS